MNTFRSKKLNKILPFLTAMYTILCTRRLQPPCHDCAVRVQWFSSARTISAITVEQFRKCMRPPPAVPCSVPSPFVLASHRQWHCISLSTTVCQGMCSCKISNIIYFTSLQIGLRTAKTLPPNTSLILQVMAIFTPDCNSATPSRF